jgi:1-acyl-sn-glycerol-3-phosphate acyltransferase
VTWVLRRLVLAPALILLTLVLLVALPVLLLVAALVSPLVQGRWRPVRVLTLLMLHLVLESVMLIELLGLWIASGFGVWIRRPYFERIHYDIIETYLAIVFRASQRVLHLELVTEGPTPDAFPGLPLIVCCRHAGPGDSFTLLYALMIWYEREPRVVLKDTIGWDPAIDVVLNRLPSRFVSPKGDAGDTLERQVGELARDLDENDAFVIFPEGGNFTPERRQRAIERLRKHGMEAMASRAERMTNVVAPRPGGFLAALDAAPEADIVLVAHTGLDHLLTVADVWRELPMDKRLVMRWWRVSRDEIPAGREERIDWLFERWQQIDTWVEEHRPVDLSRRRRGRAGSETGAEQPSPSDP